MFFPSKKIVKNSTVDFWTTLLAFFAFFTSENMSNFAPHNN